MSSDKTVRDVMLETVLNQIDTNNPPEARATYDRLIDEGASNSQALRLMSAALRAEMDRMLEEATEFDAEGYAELLAKVKVGD